MFVWFFCVSFRNFESIIVSVYHDTCIFALIFFKIGFLFCVLLFAGNQVDTKWFKYRTKKSISGQQFSVYRKITVWTDWLRKWNKCNRIKHDCNFILNSNCCHRQVEYFTLKECIFKSIYVLMRFWFDAFQKPHRREIVELEQNS